MRFIKIPLSLFSVALASSSVHAQETKELQFVNTIEMDQYDSVNLTLPNNKKIMISCGSQKVPYQYTHYELSVDAKASAKLIRKTYSSKPEKYDIDC